MRSSSLFAWIAIVFCIFALRMQRTEEAQFAPGDRLHITVADLPELTTDVQLDADGSVALPRLGHVRLAGLTAMLAESHLAERLATDGGEWPQVMVQVLPRARLKLAEATP